jgi:hypothetical protein
MSCSSLIPRVFLAHIKPRRTRQSVHLDFVPGGDGDRAWERTPARIIACFARGSEATTSNAGAGVK